MMNPNSVAYLPRKGDFDLLSSFPDILSNALSDVLDALRSLVLPALYFLVLGILLKRRAFFGDLRRVWRESGLNLQITLFDTLFVLPLIAVIAGWLSAQIAGKDRALVDPAFWDNVPAILVVLIAVFVGDFIGYWRHRLEHTAILWPSHAVHHSDTQMTWLTLARFHPINRLTTYAIDSAFLLLFALPPFAVVANNIVRHYYGFFIHADLPWTYGWLGKILVSPAMHRWHHARDRDYFQTNFATVFSVFDRAFGTFKVPGPCTADLGVTDDMAPSLWGQLSYAFRPRAYRRLIRKKQRATPRIPAE